MPERLAALPASHRIATDYQRYLRSLMPIADPQIRAALHEELSSGALVQGPFLEATPAYRRGATLRELMAEGVLPAAFAAFDSEHLPLDRPLFVHQEEALRKLRAGRNAVVATGTGSGKTESFLLPILASLAEEYERGTLDAGVRALLLYPMNALANDQMKRLRGVLERVPWVTFGRYTGETRESEKDARDAHLERFDVPPQPNELVSRERMRQGPPHLLLTNYAMLEYLLLRPEDLTLFDPADQSWRFVVVDEAHVYDGAKGAEVGMLLRRLRDRVQAPGIQAIATSATVGSDTTLSDVARFASSLFDLPFDWVEEDANRQDVVRASRVEPPAATWTLPADQRFQDIAEAPRSSDAAAGVATGFGASDIDDEWLVGLPAEEPRKNDPTGEDLLQAAAGPRAEPTAAASLAREAHLEQVRSALLTGPRLATEVAAEVFGSEPEALDSLAGLVDLAAGLRDGEGNPVLSARYHLWLSSVDRGYVCLYPGEHHGYVKDRQTCDRCEALGRDGVPVWQFAACQRCSTGYIHGRAPSGHERRSWFALTSAAGAADEDEVEDANEPPAAHSVSWLCPGCGRDAPSAGACGSCHLALLPVIPVDERLDGDRAAFDPPAMCVRCGGKREGLIRGLNAGPHASTAVLSTSVYQRLPAENPALPGHGKKLLAFSDSRQQAAYFAPYLEGSYQEILWRRLIHEAVARTEEAAGGPGTFDNVLDRLTRIAESYNIRPADGASDALSLRTHAAGWLLAEVSTGAGAASLSGRSMLQVSTAAPSPLPPPLLNMGLHEDEAWNLIQNLLETAREAGCIAEPSEIAVPRTHPAFPYRFPNHGMRLEGPEPKQRVQSWLPGRGSNRRLDHLQRVLDAKGIEAAAGTVLTGIWNWAKDGRIGLLAGRQGRAGATYRVALDRLRLSASGARYRCDTCGSWHWRSVAGVCPTKACTGRLVPTELPSEEADDDHYRTLYRSLEPAALLAKEHTAQWTSEEAARIQEEFIQGSLNVLSCSTTFELGVDVGDLQSVLLRNVPPTTANYVQRAGRAGRRGSAAALVVTYARPTPHDAAMFEDPRAMIAGTMRAPYLPIDNERIARRHVHSIVLSDFFRDQYQYGRSWGRMEDFFGPEPPTDGASLLRDYLAVIPDQVRESSLSVVPTDLHESLDLNGDTWAEHLLQRMTGIREEFRQEIDVLYRAYNEAVAAKKPSDRYLKSVRTVERRRLLARLAVKNVLPKYGFPVDVVEMATYHLGDFGDRLDLTRDLAQAITEYAPGSRIVAGGRVLTSAGLATRAGMALPEYRYGTCTNRTAKHFVLRRQAEPFPTECPDCGANIAAKRAIRPEFGFVCADERERIGSRPPKLRYPGEAEVLRFSDSPQSRTIDTPIGCVELLWGKRAELALIGEGEGTRGWWICTGCGRGIPCRATQHPPKSHKVPITGRDCTGTMGRRRFIHTFETDIVAITLPGDPLAPLESALAAIVAGASDTLEVPIDDIGGTLRVTGDRRQAVVYDTVPGGAGNAMQIAQQFELVVANAIDRVEGCNCGIDASCYACLKNHQNQRHHEDLTRKAALARLEPLELTAPSGTSGQTPVYDDPRFAALPPAWREAIELADPAAHDVLLLLAGTGIDAPEVGLELLDGRIVAELAWEPQRVAVVLADQHDAIGGWSEHGWSMFTTAQAEEILSAVRPESD